MVNGIQTMSRTYVSLLEFVPQTAAMGVTALRLMPQMQDMVAVAGVFRAVADGRVSADEGTARLDALGFGVPLSNGFWLGEAGYRRIARAS